MIHHLGHLAFSAAQFLDHHTDERFRAIDHQQLQRLVHFVIDRFSQNLGLADHQLESFAAHHFNQDGELQFTASHHLKSVRATGLFHANGHVGQQFLIQAVAQVTRCYIVTLHGPKTATY